MTASLIGRAGSSAFRLSTTDGNVTRGLVLLSGIGTSAPSIMGIEDEVERSFERPCRSIGRSKRAYELTSSIVPRGTSFHRVVELEFPPSFDLVGCSCGCSLPGPSELGAINPDQEAVGSWCAPVAARLCENTLAAFARCKGRCGAEPSGLFI
jgi:hypothetical protein